MMRLLIIEDEVKLAAALKIGLAEACSATVDVANDGEEGLFLASNLEYDAIILDLALPKIDGLSILKEIRRNGISARVLLLTAKDTIESKVRGLESGADDYITKPFDFREVNARLRALIRRPNQILNGELKVADLVLNPATRSVIRSGKVRRLSSKEFDLLEYFLRRRNTVLSRDQILEYVWPGKYDRTSNIVDVYVRLLRSKIELEGEERLIQTIWGVGYLLHDGGAS